MSNGRGVAVRTARAAATKIVLKKLNLATLKFQIIGALIIIGVLIVTVLIAGLIATIAGGSEDDSQMGVGTGINGTANVSAEVAQYRGAINAELEKYGLGQYTELMLALMMQESGGRGNDPMQASESFCGSIGCITDPQVSIEKGVIHFKKVLEKAKFDVKLTLQSYNFGGGFIDYVLKNGGSYTKELAISFSQMMYQKLAHTGMFKCHRPSAIANNACYGDIEYVDAVLKYLPSASLVDGGGGDGGMAVGNEKYQAILKDMLQFNGWSYVWGGSSPATGFDCSGLMQWAYRQHGISLPRTSYEQYKSSKRISKDQLQPGDLIFFKSANYNPVTHVGMYVGNGKMFNSNNGGVQYDSIVTGYWSKIIVGYGRVADFS